MKEIEIKATTGSEKDGTKKEFVGSCKQYESLKEADLDLGKDSLGHSKALAALNAQILTMARNGLRTNTDPEVSEMKKRLMAAIKGNPQKLKEAMEYLAAQGYNM